MNDKKRYAGDYEIIQSMSIGEKEFVLGENMNAVDGKFYIAANYESNELFERYTDVVYSCDYVDVASVFAQRLSEEIKRLQVGRSDLCMNILNKNDCLPIGNETFIGNNIVLKPEILSPEYRNENYQSNSGYSRRTHDLIYHPCLGQKHIQIPIARFFQAHTLVYLSDDKRCRHAP